MSCATRPVIGTEFRMTFNNPGSAAGINLVLVGVRLDPASTLGTPALCDAGFLHVLPLLVLGSPGNPASVPIQIPNEPLLVGQGVAVQGGSYETTNCFRLTDGLWVTIQAP